jgi:hypothetical protein
MAGISFTELSSAFGKRASAQLLLVVVITTVRKDFCLSNNVSCAKVAFVVAGLLLLAGIVDALLGLYIPRFRVIAVSGLFDGLFAGMIAGIVGGYLGFGWHPIGYLDYKTTQLHRTLLVFVFTVPVAALLGSCLSFLKPETPVNWRNELSAVCVPLSLSSC